MIKLRKLTKRENEKFGSLCRKDNLTNNDLSIKKFPGEIIPDIDVKIDETKKFRNKFDFGKYLHEKLNGIAVDEHIWHYLVIVYHKQLLKHGKIGETARFYIDSQASYYPFTHLLKPVFDLYNSYAEDTDLIEFLLLSPINETSSLCLETVKRQDMMKNKNFIRVSKKLFYNEEERKHKKGVDNILRLITLFKQYERTYDLYSMPAEKILDNLISKHAEFDKFRTG